MNRRIILAAVVMLGLFIALACAGGNDPVSPVTGPELSHEALMEAGCRTHLWGYYTVYIDVENQTATAALARHGMFTANVVNFLNENPMSMSFEILEIVPGSDYIDIDINVMLRHPFPGMDQFDGYDVRGVFMGDGSASLITNSDLIYPVLGTDQFMLADPDDPIEGNGAPDGYTRWFNFTEFSDGGMPLFLYTQGKMAHPAFAGTATLCPYKYFADGLGPSDDLWGYLDSPANHHGEFTSGGSSTRNYYLRFPDDKGTVFGYAVLANWSGPDPEDHPSNAPETIGCRVEDDSTVFYVDPGENGGNLVLDISLWDWGVEAAGVGDYAIIVESSVLSAPHALDAMEMTPVDGNENYSTYHVEINADEVTGTEDQEYWVIVEYENFDYSNEFGVTNDAWDDPLTAFFRYDLYVSPESLNQEPICDVEVVTPMPYEGWATAIEFDASGSSDPDGDDLTFEWDFDDDGVFGDSYETGTDENPGKVYETDYIGDVCVKVSDGNGGEAVCCVAVDITPHPSKNLPLRSGVDAEDIAIDHTNGDLLVLYSDKTVYKYPRVDWYQSEELFISLWFATVAAWYMDIAPNGHIIIAGTYSTSNALSLIYNPSGVLLYAPSQGGPGYSLYEAIAMTAGSYEDDLAVILDWPSTQTTYFIRYPDGDWFYGHRWHGFAAGGTTTGVDRIFYDYITGVESDGTGDYVWFLEDDPDYYASRWHVYEVGVTGYLVYDDAYFGTGSQTDNDEGWNIGLDITRDDQNRLFVLDMLSTGDPLVKVWTVSGDATTSIGSFGDTTTISADPKRIEGSDHSGEIVVLHGDSPPHMISVFIPSEMPG